jgi:hypothetical protein
VYVDENALFHPCTVFNDRPHIYSCDLGPTLRTLFASSPGGYVVRVRPFHREFKLAEDIAQFKLNLRIIKHLLVVRLVLLNTRSVMQEVRGIGMMTEKHDYTNYTGASPSLFPATSDHNLALRQAFTFHWRSLCERMGET